MSAAPVLRFRICRVGEPETTLAELDFTVGPDGDEGALKIRSEDPAMRVLVAYYLTDARDQRPVYIHGVGYRHGPHTRSAEQFGLSLSMFGSSFPAFVATPVIETGADDGDGRSVVVVDPAPVVVSPWADLRFLLSDYSVERGIGNEESVAALFAALAEGRAPSTTERYNTELMATGCLGGVPVHLPGVGEAGRELRLRAIGDLVRSFVAIDHALGAVVGDYPGPPPRTPGEPLPRPEAYGRLPASLSADVRMLGALALVWKAQWELCQSLAGRDAPLDRDVLAQIARSRAAASQTRALLTPWACFAESCGHEINAWHLDDLGADELSATLGVAARAVLLRDKIE